MRPPDKFDMVDMEGIDLLEVQGETIPGLYNKLVESITLCRYQCVYNWAFNGILIPPTYVEMEERSDGVWINEGVMVDEEDVVHIASIEPEPPTPPTPVEPVIQSLSVTSNGTYTVPSGVDGFNPVSVNVPSSSMLELDHIPLDSEGSVGDYCIVTIMSPNVVGFAVDISKVARGSSTNFVYWGTSAFRVSLEKDGITYSITDLQNYSICLSPNTLYGNTVQENSLFTNAPSGSYKERNGLPGYFVIKADDISDYKLKSFSFCRRPGSTYIDYVVSFDVYAISNTGIIGSPLISVSNLTQSDWPDGQLVEFNVDQFLGFSKMLYYKEETGWVQII